MDANQILLIVIVVLVSIIIVVVAYFLIIHLINHKRSKKIDNVFNPTNLIEEDSLMNVMDEKKNVDFKKASNNEERFVLDNEDVKIATSDALTREQKANPFGVDLTKRTKDNQRIEIKDPKKSGKFFN